MEHINSVKYILRKRNLLQKELILYRPDGTMLFNKQYVSKVIHGHFRIPVEAISEWSSILDIPPDFFVDKETGKCKILSSMDTKEIDSYIDAQFYIENTEKDKILSRSAEAEIALRHHSLSVNITKLQRNIRKDIYSINQDADDEISALNIQEANLEFYRKITELHRTNLLSNMEWNSFFRAFHFAEDNIDGEDLSDEHPLVYGMYILIKKHRELISIQQRREIQDYEDLFGSLINNFDNYYE